MRPARWNHTHSWTRFGSGFLRRSIKKSDSWERERKRESKRGLSESSLVSKWNRGMRRQRKRRICFHKAAVNPSLAHSGISAQGGTCPSLRSLALPRSGAGLRVGEELTLTSLRTAGGIPLHIPSIKAQLQRSKWDSKVKQSLLCPPPPSTHSLTQCVPATRALCYRCSAGLWSKSLCVSIS